MIQSSTYLVFSIIVHKRLQILQVRFFNFPRCSNRWRNFHLTGESSKDWVHFALVHPLIGFKTRANLLARPIRRTLKTIAHSPSRFPALQEVYVLALWALIGSLQYHPLICSDWPMWLLELGFENTQPKCAPGERESTSACQWNLRHKTQHLRGEISVYEIYLQHQETLSAEYR